MCVKFQFSSSDSFRDMRGSQLRIGGAVSPHTPVAENFYFQKVELSLSKDV